MFKAQEQRLANKRKWAVVIVAAGYGSRFGHDIPKQYLPLHGKRVLRHCLDLFAGMPEMAEILCVIDPQHRHLFDEATAGMEKKPKTANGGDSRQQSVFNGLKGLSKDLDFVMVHDAARPLLEASSVRDLIRVLEQGGYAATLAASAVDTFVRVEEGGKCGDTVDRTGLYSIQTPQAFPYAELVAAHEKLQRGSFTDDTGIFAAATGRHAQLVQSSRANIKITTAQDMRLAEKLLGGITPMDIRTGSGFDVHAFDDDAGAVSSIRLFGVDIAHNRKLKGHSDADVGLHAIADAILGAAAAGDIGIYFPPGRDETKNIDSALIVDKAMAVLAENGGKLHHADVTFLGEEPKIMKHREAILERLAALLHIPANRIGFKATTTEKLGYLGRAEGLAVQALVTCRFDDAQ